MAGTKAMRETTKEKGRRHYDAGCVAKLGEERWEVEGSNAVGTRSSVQACHEVRALSASW